MTNPPLSPGLSASESSIVEPIVESVTDEQLMLAIRAGDKPAFAELYDRYAGAIYGVCLRVVRQSSDAEAVVSDIFCELWRKSNGFDPLRGSCRTYLFTLARSRAIDRLRATQTRTQKTKAAMLETADKKQQLQVSQGPCEKVLADERQQAVRTAVEKLDREHREALSLAYFEGLTHSQISQRLDRPLGTIKTHIRRGLQTLKAALNTLGGPDGL